MRTRAAAILIQNHALALIERHRGGKHYFTFPGGGVDPGETPKQEGWPRNPLVISEPKQSA